MGVSEIFIGYSRQDKLWVERLSEHLTRRKVLHWFDRRLDVGDEVKLEIQNAIWNARFAVVLVSKAFLESKFVTQHELPWLDERRSAGELAIYPVLIHHLEPSLTSWLGELQFKPPLGEKGLEELAPEQADRELDELAQKIQRKVGSAKWRSKRRHLAALSIPAAACGIYYLASATSSAAPSPEPSERIEALQPSPSFPIEIYSATQGGTYYVHAKELASLFPRTPDVHPTNGGIDNCQRLKAIDGDVLALGYTGLHLLAAPSDDSSCAGLRALLPLYEEFTHIVTTRSFVERARSQGLPTTLAGLLRLAPRVQLGAPDSSTRFTARRLLQDERVLHLQPGDLAPQFKELPPLGFEAAMIELVEGRADIAFFESAKKFPALQARLDRFAKEHESSLCLVSLPGNLGEQFGERSVSRVGTDVYSTEACERPLSMLHSAAVLVAAGRALDTPGGEAVARWLKRTIYGGARFRMERRGLSMLFDCEQASTWVHRSDAFWSVVWPKDRECPSSPLRNRTP